MFVTDFCVLGRVHIHPTSPPTDSSDISLEVLMKLRTQVSDLSAELSWARGVIFALRLDKHDHIPAVRVAMDNYESLYDGYPKQRDTTGG